MIGLPCLLLLASASGYFVDETYRIPANKSRYVDLGLEQRPAQVVAEFRVDPDTQQVRIALMRRDDEERFHAGVPYGVMATSSYAQSGTLVYRVPEAGEYVLVVDNLERPAANVHLRIRRDFAAPGGPAVRRLSPARQLTVVAISCAVFFGIVTYSARRLLEGMRRE
jgi:hypothetical protein